MASLIAAGATIIGVYLGQIWIKRSKTEDNFFKNRRHSYYKYMTVFSEAGREREWTRESASEKILILWKTALEAGEYGDIRGISCKATLKNIFKNDDLAASNLKLLLARMGNFDGKETTYDIIEDITIYSFYGFIALIEALMQFDPEDIEIDFLVEYGSEYFPIFRNILLSESERTPIWAKWAGWFRERYGIAPPRAMPGLKIIDDFSVPSREVILLALASSGGMMYRSKLRRFTGMRYDVLDAMLAELASEGQINISGDMVRLKSARPFSRDS
ncbi:MAG: hypothetical protein PHQ34_01360 [Methanothrix sp.]|nr:hypothetical protein [Methanothrix sp.]